MLLFVMKEAISCVQSCKNNESVKLTEDEAVLYLSLGYPLNWPPAIIKTE